MKLIKLKVKVSPQPIRMKLAEMPFDRTFCDVGGYDRAYHATGYAQLGRWFTGKLVFLNEYELPDGRTFLR